MLQYHKGIARRNPLSADDERCDDKRERDSQYRRVTSQENDSPPVFDVSCRCGCSVHRRLHDPESADKSRQIRDGELTME